MKKHNRITTRALALLMALAFVLSFSSCFNDNWDIPEREEPDVNLGELIGALAGVSGTHKYKELLPSGIVLTLSEDGGHYIVANGTGCTEKKVTIPASYKGVPVKEIAEGAFSGLSTLEEILLPNSIKSVGAGAFNKCSALKFTIEDGYYYLGNIENPHLVLIRLSTSKLDNVKINEKTRVIAAEAFIGNRLIKQITIPDSVVSVGKRAFKNCSYVYDVEIGDGVETIEEEAFFGTIGVKTLSIGSAVTTIGKNAFKDNNLIEYVDIPDSVSEIGESAFASCENLGKVTIGEGVKVICDKAFSDCPMLESIMFGEAVEYLGRQAFADCVSLSSLFLPGSIEILFPDTFENCAGISYRVYRTGFYLGTESNPYEYLVGFLTQNASEIRMHKNTRRIAATLFSTNPMLTKVSIDSGSNNLYVDGNCIIDTKAKKLIAGFSASVIPNDGNFTEIADYAFYGINRIRSIVIPSSVLTIGDYAFCESQLHGVTINGATSIGKEAFKNCNLLTSVDIQSDLESIGDSAFENCTALTSITIPDSVTDIGKSAFLYCTKMKYAYIGEGIRNIPASLFERCSTLAKISGGKNIVSIGDRAFDNCRNLESFAFNDGIEYIGERAFYTCSLIKAVRLPNSVTEVGDLAFKHCTGVETISIGNGMKKIGEEAFDLTGTNSFLYNGTLEQWQKVEFGLQNKDMTVVFTDGTSYDIPGKYTLD